MSAIIRFVVGSIAGGIAAYFACHAYVLMTEGPADTAAFIHNQSLAEYEADVQKRLGPRFLAFTVMGTLFGGATWALRGNYRSTTTIRRGRRMSSDESFVVLDRDEFRRVLATCAWVNLQDKTSDYMQGLVVGRLADTDPSLAKRVDSLDEFRMGQLVAEMKRKKRV